MRMTRVKRITRATAVAVLAMAVLAFGPTWERSGGNAHAQAKTITIGVGAVPKAVSTEDLSQLARYLWMYMYDKLVWPDQQGNIVPSLAASWSNPDSRTWRFLLRKGAKWHDGSEVTAEDVKFTIDWVFNPQNNHPFRSQLPALQGASVEVVDRYTADIKTPEPIAVMLPTLLQLSIVPRNFAGKSLEEFRRSPVGSGAFRFRRWVPGDVVELQANRDYWNGAPKFDALIFKAMPEMGSRIAALEAGQIQAVSDVLPEEVERLKQNGFRVLIRPTGQTMTVLIPGYLSQQFPALKDVRVRQAMDYALDKEGMVKHLTLGLGEVAQGQRMPATTFGFNPKVKARPYDPQKAKRLLAEAGYPKGFPLVFEVPVGRYFKGDEVAELLTAQWREIGIDVRQVRTESGVFIQRWLAAKFEGVIFAGQNVAPGMDYQFQMTSFICNFAGKFMCNPQFEALYEKQKATLDRRERLKVLHEMAALDFELAPSIPLFVIPGIHAVTDKIDGAIITADNHLDLRTAAAR